MVYLGGGRILGCTGFLRAITRIALRRLGPVGPSVFGAATGVAIFGDRGLHGRLARPEFA
uniref:Uncharacterized protein n=1 Tax=Ralstonia solanacearum CFBP2957 TaxID=859656 RepID=D8P390_RALSL|nr:protein of unknown function [Ralstonia solanacearum CFBP2957]